MVLVSFVHKQYYYDMTPSFAILLQYLFLNYITSVFLAFLTQHKYSAVCFLDPQTQFFAVVIYEWS